MHLAVLFIIFIVAAAVFMALAAAPALFAAPPAYHGGASTSTHPILRWRHFSQRSDAKTATTQKIIHISGPSGAGKTTLGREIAEKFPGVVVKDIDDLRSEFIRNHYRDKSWSVIDKVAYQRHIDKFVAQQTSPIVFVGLNNMPWWHRDHYYDMHAGHKFYIDIDDAEVVRRKCTRLLGDIPNDPKAMRHLAEDNAKFVKLVRDAITHECSAPKTIKMNRKWAADYKKQHYKFAPAAEILAEVVKILS